MAIFLGRSGCTDSPKCLLAVSASVLSLVKIYYLSAGTSCADTQVRELVSVQKPQGQDRYQQESQPRVRSHCCPHTGPLFSSAASALVTAPAAIAAAAAGIADGV